MKGTHLSLQNNFYFRFILRDQEIIDPIDTSHLESDKRVSLLLQNSKASNMYVIVWACTFTHDNLQVVLILVFVPNSMILTLKI